jgi:hypothetical protein
MHTTPPPVAASAGSPGPVSSWQIGSDLWAFVAEGFVAALLRQCDEETIWFGGNRQGADVYACFQKWRPRAKTPLKDSAKLKVDVKRAFLMQADLGSGRSSHLGFMGSGRALEARSAAVTHYALVLFDENYTDGELLVNGPDARVAAAYRVERVFLVPAVEVNSEFKSGRNAAGLPSGLNLFVDLVAMSAYEIFPRRQIDPCGACPGGLTPSV